MASISQVRICNMALSHVGASDTIESIEEKSPQGKECKLWYDFARLEILEGYDWTFARFRLALAAHDEDPPEGYWAYRYQYPSNCVKFRRIVNPLGEDADPVPFQVELDSAAVTKTILTDLEEATGIFTRDVTATTLFTPLFIKAMSYSLASMIAPALTGKNEIQQTMANAAAYWLLRAPAVDANEQGQKPPREAEWVRGR